MENMQLAQRLRAFRKLKGFTQQELAERTGISLTVLGAVERGNRTIDLDMLNIIAQTLEIEVRELTE
ncbi:helix-turn-helix transcriptional regulator [Paenibacillus polymyxa]|uniref:Helix-turn-helix transcriptional regulator n=1 Tax=Paenibacillus polymyxa TaxID=1406 RepID=A0A8I1J5E6_PAEPO|nr:MULTISPECIES: helix-turn-helix transcriptional regulator [Paenibacillus]KAF6567954.1 helix-turn-helix transcriptional regulator [Paenibacillus sp. EKM206P]KAF6585193.1 helix-turn-helix transcriptional regulator [Paenibacillus sp. EKM205P]MBM0636075.1 helix-turn-helix transcriptional regulator [Paenibacillus polymyxa]MBP1312519.1 transcriptional regulator with XRE-family HTH domain [Paenibacillus sp. 1182]MCH6190489.1 helix-turn-helix domain-containing protein [Paenibacillus polymyxa]